MRETLAVEYFDGVSARPQPATLVREGGRWRLELGAASIELDPRTIRWPERQRHGARIAHLADGGAIHGHDALAWDAFVRDAGLRESWVVRAQQNWRATLGAVLLLVTLVFAGYRWGLPVASSGLLVLIPQSIDASIGDAVMASVESRWLQPSRLPPEVQARLRDGFERAAHAADPPGARPAYTLQFRRSRIGPNALALPGGTIVVTDELVELLKDRDDVVIGVLAHELGHVRARHGMRSLVQVALLGTVTSVALGDFSTVLAGAPALFGQLAYSRDAEREADAEAARVLRAAGLSPAVMVELFTRLDTWRRDKDGREQGADFDPPIAFSSHPADEERIAFFRDAAR